MCVGGGGFLLRLFEDRTHPEGGQDLLRGKLCLFPVCLPVCALLGLHLSCCSCYLQWQCCCMNSDMQPPDLQPSLFSLPTWLPVKPPGFQHQSGTAEAFSLVDWVITAFLMWRHPLLNYEDYTMLSSLINPLSMHIHSCILFLIHEVKNRILKNNRATTVKKKKNVFFALFSFMPGSL